MSLEHINQLLKNKDWATVAHSLEESINSDSDPRLIIDLFEKIPLSYREENCFHIFLKLWQPALSAGKLKLARDYAQLIIFHLIRLKRFPYLAELIQEFKKNGLTKLKFPEEEIEIIRGIYPVDKLQPSESWDLVSLHPEKWKESRSFLKNYLMQSDEWQADQWKLAYEYILNFHFDLDILFLISQKASDLKKTEHVHKFEKYFSSNGLGSGLLSQKKFTEATAAPVNSTHFDYDELALHVMSGELEPSRDEQRKVLITLKDIEDSELLVKGKDMIVAFSLLGMEEVVLYLCRRTIPLLQDLKSKISLHYTCAQTLFDRGNYHSLIDYVDDMTEKEPLLKEERIAFDYLKAEALFKLKRYKQAGNIFAQIKKFNPYFRLVSQRLRDSETA